MSRAEYYSEAEHGPHEISNSANFTLESGITLPTPSSPTRRTER